MSQESIEKDAARFRWLMEKAVTMRRADTQGPECPLLQLAVDLWNEDSKTPAVERIIKFIDSGLEDDTIKAPRI